MSSITLMTLLSMAGMAVVGTLIYFAIRSSQKARERYMTLYDLTDGRMTELIALNKQAAELVGRAAERADQIVREQREKDQSDLQRRIQTTEQADRFMTEQEKAVPPEKR
jgi:F0F1-type ATP synthase membrane subunit b/b'